MTGFSKVPTHSPSPTRKLFSMMSASPGLPSGCLPSSKVEAKEDELNSEWLVSIDAEGAGGGECGANDGCAI